MATTVGYLAWAGLATSAAAVLLQGRPQLRPELLEGVWVDCLWLQVTEGPSEGPLEGPLEGSSESCSRAAELLLLAGLG